MRLDVTALTFGVDRVKGKGRFSGAAESGDDRQRIVRNIKVNVFEIVDAYPADNNALRPCEVCRYSHKPAIIQCGYLTKSLMLFVVIFTSRTWPLCPRLLPGMSLILRSNPPALP